MPRTVVLNIEANGLTPDRIWCATTIDIDTGEEHEFRNPDTDLAPFLDYMRGVAVVIGHNILGYDWPVLTRLCRILEMGVHFDVLDTLVVSRVLDFNRSGGHSLAAWAPALGLEKTVQPPWDEFSEALVAHSMQNCRLTLALYRRFQKYIESRRWTGPIRLEHFIAAELQTVHENGFHFSLDKAKELRYNISREVEKFDKQILGAFHPKINFIREIHPRLTKFGTFNRNDFRWHPSNDLSDFNGGPFSLIEYTPFNPGSPAQIVERLNEAGWKPTEKTKSHLQALRDKDQERIAKFEKTGFKVSETNLNTLPETAPDACKLLAKRIKYASRVRVLNEWIENTHEDGRIHGRINHVGAWTHRCSHDKPNTGNIPRDDAEFGREMRSLWCVDDGYLVGVDAESIQLRVLAHYIRDDRFTASLLSGKKEDGTDPHSLNKQALGTPCKSRNDAKTFIYAWLLGAGIAKVAEILGCSHSEAKQANEDFIGFYPGLKILKNDIIPKDASRGYFEGFDGRFIKIFGDDESSRAHFCLAGYLQAGETIVMKEAKAIWIPRLRRERISFKLVNFVHDEDQTQVPPCDSFIEREVTFETKHLKSHVGCSYNYTVIKSDKDLTTVIQRVPENALYVAEVQAEAIKLAGEKLGLRCPMAGSILSGHGPIAIGKNWYETH